MPVPDAEADSARLNDAVVANVYRVQQPSGCSRATTVGHRLPRAAPLHTRDMLANRTLDGDIGSDGSCPQERARAAGFTARLSETVAVNSTRAISGIELLNRWHHSDAYYASECANTATGVWSAGTP